MENYLDKLNTQQRQAVVYTDGPELVIAGAGSGKTRVLTYKIVHLLEMGYSPGRIMALTFTNKAAREMRERIEALVGHSTASRLWMGTFHSIFSRILHINAELIGFKPDFTIYDASDSKSLIKLILKDMGLNEDKSYNPSSLQSHFSNMKNALIQPADYARNRDLREDDNRQKRPLTYIIYDTYCKRCRLAGAMDFDDLLLQTNILLRDNPELLKKYQDFFQYILVDEYQDTNFAQHLIVLQLSKKHNRVCVVGDDAQSIYSFRGANISNILSLEKAFPGLKTFKLERNYRSTQNIIEAANSLIHKNKNQIHKNIFSENEPGTKIKVVQCFSDYEEAYVVANQISSMKARSGDRYEDFAVLYRTNAQSRVLEEALKNGGKRDKHGNRIGSIPYRIYGGLSFYQRKEVKDAISYFRFIVNPDDDEALRRIINYPTRGIGDTTMGKIQHAALQAGVSMWNVICNPVRHNLSFNSGIKKKLDEFRNLVEECMELNRSGANAYDTASHIINKTGLLSVLLTENTPENISRQENINELLNAILDFSSLAQEEGNENVQLVNFLAEAALATDQDKEQNDGDCVTLMTVHAAKGLEFNNIIIVGVEEDLFPSALSADRISGIEEERRLFYVAITRAKKNCIITFATSRYHNGQTKTCTQSRFLRDIDPQYLSFSQTSFGKQSKPQSFTSISSAQRDSSQRSSLFPNRSISSTPTQHQATFQTKQPAVSSAATSGGNFTSHSIGEVSVGTRIQHNRFGSGTITSIDNSKDPKIIVSFDNFGEKTLLLQFAKFQIIKN